jgi:hypothetical protein
VLDDMNAFGQEWQVLDTDPKLFQTRFLNPQVHHAYSQASSMLRRRLSESSVEITLKGLRHWGDGTG